VGQGNPAAVALQFYSNNSGAVRDCRFVAPPGSGWVGLDLAHRDMNGPVFVTRCEVTGFRRGIVTGHSVNSQTFEHLALRGQSEFAFFHEVCYNGDPFETWVRETRGTRTRFLRRGEGSLLPFAGFAP